MISVIVPVYNVEFFLPRCLESIAAQTYNNFEAILVDDGSTDSSGAICDVFCAKDSRFLVIHQNNSGVSEARNAGLRIARGDFFYFIDGDDYIHISTLETLYRAISKGYKLAMIDFRRTYTLDEDIFHKDVSSGEVVIEHSAVLMSLMLGTSADEGQWMSGVVWNKLYSREVISDIFFNDYYIGEDQDFNYRVLLNVDEIIHVKEQLYFYLQRPHSIVSETTKRCEKLISLIKLNFSMLSYTDSSKCFYRGRVLQKLYRRILTTRYNLSDTPFEKESHELFHKILSETGREYFVHKGISFKEKLQFLLLWFSPWLMKLCMRLTGN